MIKAELQALISKTRMSLQRELTALRIDNHMLSKENESMRKALRVMHADNAMMYGVVMKNKQLLKANKTLLKEVERLREESERLKASLQESQMNETRAMLSNQRLFETISGLQDRLFSETIERD